MAERALSIRDGYIFKKLLGKAFERKKSTRKVKTFFVVRDDVDFPSKQYF